MSGGVVIPHSVFTFSRTQGNTLVSESSDLEAQGYFKRGTVPSHLRVRGRRETVLYQRAAALDVYDAGREDLVARVYVPAPPYNSRPELPQLHVLND